jgi:hypothetical protein
VSRFFNNIENHIMEGLFPDSILTFTPCDANPKLLHVANIIAHINKIAALKVKPDALPLETPTFERTTKKSRRSNLPPDLKTSQRPVYLIARKGDRPKNCFPVTS